MKTIPCPHCGRPVKVAALLGALGAGKPKKFTKAEIRRRTARLAAARATRKTLMMKLNDEQLKALSVDCEEIREEALKHYLLGNYIQVFRTWGESEWRELLGLTSRSRHVVIAAACRDGVPVAVVKDEIRNGARDLSKVRNCGRKSVEELRAWAGKSQEEGGQADVS